MNVNQLLLALQSHEISVELEGNDLLLNFDGEDIPEVLIEQIKINKPALVAYLKKYAGQEKFTEILPAPVQDSYPLSVTQRRLWILSQFPEMSMAYIMPNQVDLPADTDLHLFSKAVDAVIARHEILRTVFREDQQGEIRQWIQAPEDLHFQIAIIDADGDEAAAAYIEADGFKAFDLENGPLFRAALIRLPGSRYRFYYIMHHIISDGWSLGVLINDVLSYYNAYRNNTAHTIQPLKIQYKDYANWQSVHVNTGNDSADRTYWIEQFADDIPALDISAGRTRPQVRTNNGAILETYLSEEATTALRTLTQQQGGSLFVTLLSIWNTLFYRYSEQQDIIIGTAVAGRNHAYLEDQIGFYVNTLALRNRVSAEEAFSSLYQRVRENALDAFSHETFPFDQLVEELQLTRDSSRNPLFDVMLTLLDGNSPAQAGAFKTDVRYKGRRNAKFDIEINVVVVGQQLQLTANYNTDIYTQDIVTNLLMHFQALCVAVTADPEKSIADYDFLSESEKNKLLYAFNDTKEEWGEDRTITELFEQQVALHPDDIAVTSAGGSLTYNELNIAANRMGHYLRNQFNVGADDLVGIQLPREERLLTAIYGVLKAGAAYVPIDPENPEERKAYIAKNAGCKCVIDSAFMEGFAQAANVLPVQNPEKINTPASLAYVIYTSGSTGNPKGVMIEHHSLVNRLVWMQQAYRLQASDVILQKTTYSFDVSVWELVWWSLYGASVHLLEPQGEKNPAAIVDAIDNGEVTVMHFVPSMLSTFLQYLKQFPEEKVKLHTLRQVFTSGEALSKNHRDLFVEGLPGVSLMNLYGPTEASIDVTWYDCTAERADNIIPIGKPISNIQMYVLDKQRRLVPIGVKGRLYIAGKGLARGYVNNPELTAERFIANPFNDGEKLYDTGDLAVWLPDGNIHFLGRVDDQVKVRGFRIELGEIEYHLRTKETIADAVVLAKEVTTGQHDLVAYIVAAEKQSVADLRDYLAGKLPYYMVPAHFIQIDTMPLNASGKADRKKLLAMKQGSLSDSVAYVAPSNEQEQVLADVCTAVLGKEKISMSESFYNLGGDSIKAIQIVSRLRQSGYSLRVEEVLKAPVLSSLAKLLVRQSTGADQSAIVGDVLLTPVQRYLFDNFPVPQHFNQSLVLKSERPIDMGLLDKCLATIVQHHDALRLVFQQQEGEWQASNNPSTVKSYTLTSYGAADMQEVGNVLQASFDLTNGPLLKVAHFTRADGDRLLIIAHHLVIDAVSWRIFIEDLQLLYTQVNARLPEKTDSFRRWAQLQQEYANSGKLLAEAAYWQELVAQQVPRLKTDFPFNTPVFLQDQESFVLDQHITNLLQTRVHRVYNTEINDVLLTALGSAILEVFGQDKVIIKMEGHGREEIIRNVDISRTIGWFTTMYPFVLHIPNEDSLVAVKEDLRRIPGKGIGFGMLKYLREDYQALSYTPSVLFNYLGNFDNSFGADNKTGFSYAAEPAGNNIAEENAENVVLNISGSIVAEQLFLSINYSSQLYTQATIQRLSAAYKLALIRLIENVASEYNTFKTPSDLSYKGLSIAEVNTINADRRVEDIYELSPLQQGIYYHWLTETSSAQYFEQISYRINTDIMQPEAIRDAFQQLIDRYGVLRTSFVNSLSDVPLQIVRKDVTAAFYHAQLPASLPEEDIDAYVEQFKRQDREQGFDLTADSLMRLKLLDLGNNRYEFVWSHHHILMDGWCMNILIQDFNNLLAEKTLPAIKPYADYIHWLKERDNNTSYDYWKHYLADFDTVSTVPFTKNTIEDGYEDEVMSVTIDGALFERVRQLCNELSITQSTFLQTVWGVLLSRYNNTKDVVFGAVVSGRPADMQDIERMVGLFINTIPVRIRYNGSETISELLVAVQQQGIDSTAHHYLNLATIKAQELVNHIMVFENFPVKEAVKGNVAESDQKLSVEAVNVFEQTNYDFNILVLPGENALQVDFRFNANKYDIAAIDRLTGHFHTLLQQFVTRDIQLNQLSLAADVEIAGFNATDTIYADKVVLDLFEEQVATAQERIAVSDLGTQLSYGMLNEMTGQLADYLHHQYTIGAEELVGIRLDRSTDMLVAILGILKAGAAYVPVDMHYPEERISYIQADSRYKVCIDAAFMERFVQVRANYDSQYRIDGTYAYAIYTSGSTGEPKGVLNSHAGLYNRLLWMRDELGITADDIILQKTPYTFDVSVWELLLPGITGSELVFAKPEGHKDPAYLQELIYNKQITVLHFVPSMLGIFLEQLEPGKCDSLQHVVCSGEALPASMVADFKRLLPGVRLYNLYGPTEAAIDVTFVELTNAATVTIGKPVANTRIYIVDEQMQQQPIGVPGELLIEGVQVAAGYLNKPALSAERFIPSPFRAGERIYRTGDLAKWLPDGQIAYLGRIDHQVKIRGNRIELGEIETKLEESPYVEQGVVVVKGEGAHRYLAAYVIPAEGYDQDELYAYLSARLPEYMVPGVITTMESFPLTVSGKLNRKALPEPVLNSSDSYVAPRTDSEQRLAEIWMKVLGITQVGIHDNFFRIGGDSILSIRLISRVNKVFNATLTIGQLYEAGTIAQLSVLLEDQLLAHASRSRIKEEITARVDSLRERILPQIPGAADVYPMSDIQKGMVILSTLNPQAGVYHDQFVFHMPASDPVLFREAFLRLVSRHATLRTHFDLTTYGEEVQIVDESISFDIEYHDLRNQESSAQEQHIREFMVSERGRPFSPDTFMWRADVFRVTPTTDLFLFQFHHAILDGWSIASLNTELFSIYNDPSAQLHPLKATLKDAVIEELCEKHNQATIAFWQEELADYNRLGIFESGFCNHNLVKAYDFSFKYELEKRCRKDGITVKTLLYGAFVYVLHMLGREQDFVTGMVSNNRPVIEDGDNILGCFLNTIPVRNRMEGVASLSWKQYFLQLEKQLIQLKQQERLTLYEISRITNEKASAGSPFFDVLFNYVDFYIYDELNAVNEIRDSQQLLNVNSYETTNTAFDFNVNLSGKELVVEYKLRRELLSGVSLDQLHAYFNKVLTIYLTSPDLTISKTSFLSDDDRAQLARFNATDIGYADKAILDLFKEKVATAPERIAVSDLGTQLSYRVLNEMTGQLADYLHQQYAIGAEELVGIRLDRSTDMLVAILGILKAGAAYVPVDMHYPEERISYIQADSRYKVCIDAAFMERFAQVRTNYDSQYRIDGTYAYAIYTSGSTGEPKGVLNSHAGLYNRLLWMRDELGITADDIILQKTPYTFDVSVWELLLPVITGSELVFAKPEGHKDPAYLQELIYNKQITVLHFVPSMLDIFLEQLEPGKCDSLQHVVCSGEALPASMVADFKRLLPGVRLYNLYGPTEAAIDVTFVELTNAATVTIGKPVANTRIYIVDEQLQQQPIGVPGELLIEGVQVAAGYLNKPALSAERFIPSPFRVGDRIYRTGDLAKWLPDGEIAYLGRIDHQVKIRGNRIELGEIETKLEESPYVEQGVAVVKGEGAHRYLAAYVIPAEGYDQDELYAYLSARLPDYMVPGVITTMESFPLTVSGKLNRKALPEPAIIKSDSYVAPRTATEISVAEIWSEVLNLEQVGVHDNFFRIGGDSIMSIRLISRINKAFNVVLTIAQLYESPTIAGLCEQLETNAASAEESQKVRDDIRMSLDSLRAEIMNDF
ncbi:non-ribosomal peptide synthetase [Chitinophaga rhizophila]|uniref:Amino acid adenylation domain-containing protein n=1 Tax=Chitinophaga rhizophila TaxID=2866212 RepID=A0ABS7GHK4_9BACT|nr:non-ribosomal peptide synthetase [Chitinophaga rhizophila]MBW8687177.1 amino acid adenylation domain-containing protein [Chitinophaga rhizophila]